MEDQNLEEVRRKELEESIKEWTQLQDELRPLGIEWNNSVLGLKTKRMSLGNYGVIDYGEKTITMPMFARGHERGERLRDKLKHLAEKLGYTITPDPVLWEK